MSEGVDLGAAVVAESEFCDLCDLRSEIWSGGEIFSFCPINPRQSMPNCSSRRRFIHIWDFHLFFLIYVGNFYEPAPPHVAKLGFTRGIRYDRLI